MSSAYTPITLSPAEDVAQRVCRTNPTLALLKTAGFEQHTFNVKVERFEPSNQQASGRCWLFAGVSLLRVLLKKRYKDLPETFQYSVAYLHFFDMYEKSYNYLQTVIETRELPLDDRRVTYFISDCVSDGGTIAMFARLVDKYGLCTQVAFSDSFCSNNTKILLLVLNNLLSMAAIQLRETRDTNKTTTIVSVTMRKVQRLLTIMLGTPPERFEFCYSEKEQVTCKGIYTPREFAALLKTNLNEYVSLSDDPRHPRSRRYTIDYSGNLYLSRSSYINVSMDVLLAVVVASVRAGMPVWCAIDGSAFLNKSEGWYDEDQFAFKTILGVAFELTKAQRLQYFRSGPNHAVLITGLQIDDGGVSRLRLENSWGKTVSPSGHFSCSISFFKAYAYNIAVAPAFVPRLSIKGEDITLDPWDAMGALAANQK